MAAAIHDPRHSWYLTTEHIHAQSQSPLSNCPCSIPFTVPTILTSILRHEHSPTYSNLFIKSTDALKPRFTLRRRSLKFGVAAIPERNRASYPREKKGFVEEMRSVTMKLHKKDQSKQGEREADVQPFGEWQPTIQGYLNFLVDSKVVYDTLEGIMNEAVYPAYSEFRNTGLERSHKLAQDLQWFRSQGYDIPEPGGRLIQKKITERLLDGKQLDFYTWDADLQQLVPTVKDKLNKVAECWSMEEKHRCLRETEASFKYSEKIICLMIA